MRAKRWVGGCAPSRCIPARAWTWDVGLNSRDPCLPASGRKFILSLSKGGGAARQQVPAEQRDGAPDQRETGQLSRAQFLAEAAPILEELENFKSTQVASIAYNAP